MSPCRLALERFLVITVSLHGQPFFSVTSSNNLNEQSMVISLHSLILGKHKFASASECWKLELPLILLSVPHKDVLAKEMRVQVHTHLGSPA